MFDNINLDEFWDDSDYALEEYVLKPVTDHYIQEIEHELGYKLPESYTYLMKKHDGGIPKTPSAPVKREPAGRMIT